MPLTLEEVLRDHWPAFARRHVARLAPAHYRAVRAVLSCRTPVLGGHVWQCSCPHHHTHYAYHSCNHRSCPQCGALDQQKWAATQEARLLPGVPYFLLTLTVPQELHGLCKFKPDILYDLLLREAAGAVKDLCRSKIGGNPGFTTVLHTWGRQMQHHPHRVRVRHHGWMSGAARKTRLLVRALVCGELDEPKPVLPEPPVPRCPHCGATMKLLAVIKPRGPPTHPQP